MADPKDKAPQGGDKQAAPKAQPEKQPTPAAPIIPPTPASGPPKKDAAAPVKETVTAGSTTPGKVVDFPVKDGKTPEPGLSPADEAKKKAQEALLKALDEKAEQSKPKKPGRPPNDPAKAKTPAPAEKKTPPPAEKTPPAKEPEKPPEPTEAPRNGKGYYRLSGDDIHPYARLVAVADVFDALYSARPYKAPWKIGRIQGYFSEQAGEQFDPELAMLLLTNIADVQAVY